LRTYAAEAADAAEAAVEAFVVEAAASCVVQTCAVPYTEPTPVS
jgi:hypothetical protein